VRFTHDEMLGTVSKELKVEHEKTNITRDKEVGQESQSQPGPEEPRDSGTAHRV
jgi:hypothetical protein